MKNNNTINRIGFIDSLRGIAALYVVIFHMVLVPPQRPVIPQLLKHFVLNGFTGVTLFFIISAFTLCYTLQFQQKEANYLGNFYIRRIFRIVPLYYVWLIFVVVFKTGTGIDYGFYTHKFHLLILSFFGYNFVPGEQEGAVWASWTLGVEMVFYMFFPLIFKFVKSFTGALVFLGVSFLIAAGHYLFIQHRFDTGALDHSKYMIPLSLLHQLPVFALGIVTYHLYVRIIAMPNVTKANGTAMLLTGGVLFILSAYLVQSRVSGLLYNYIISIPLILIFLGLSINPTKILVNKFTIFYGSISFSLYLNHPTIVNRLAPFYKFINDHNVNTTLRLLICYLVTLGVATVISVITFRLIEKPGMAFGKKMIKLLAEKGKVTTAAKA